MLAYAANRPTIAARRSSPNAMLMVIAAHVAAVAAVMSVKMDLPVPFIDPPTKVDLIREPTPPEPQRSPEPRAPRPRTDTALDQPTPFVPTPPTGDMMADSKPVPLPNIGDLIGPAPDPAPMPKPAPVKVEARLLTPAAELKPPYPQSKLLNEEEAVLRLRLTIDERGRVVAVDPVGPADRVFVEAARRHLVMRWRYQPAIEDGHAVLSRQVITLRFQLDG
jgi:protein TonB